MDLIFQEKFLKDTFENLSFTPESKERFKKSLDEEERKQEEAEEVGGFNPRQSISTKFLSRSQQANIKYVSTEVPVCNQLFKYVLIIVNIHYMWNLGQYGL